MKIYLDGWGYKIEGLTDNDVRSLFRMIKSAGLNERRDFNDLRTQIEDLEKNGLISK